MECGEIDAQTAKIGRSEFSGDAGTIADGAARKMPAVATGTKGNRIADLCKFSRQSGQCLPQSRFQSPVQALDRFRQGAQGIIAQCGKPGIRQIEPDTAPVIRRLVSRKIPFCQKRFGIVPRWDLACRSPSGLRLRCEIEPTMLSWVQTQSAILFFVATRLQRWLRSI